ncbi:MAG: ComF family protein [Akkermansiaceae bacterium]|nr:ComF family protein [Akkermansiaceae bacterium]
MIPARWLDYLYPPSCHFCDAPLRKGRYLCDACRAKLHPIATPFCLRCGMPFDGALPDHFECHQCRGQDLSFEFARAAYLARDEARELMHSFKYEKQLHLHRDLASLAADAWNDPRLATQTAPPWTLVPVPLHWRRKQWRWFNQAEEIARTLARERNLPLVKALRRVRYTTQQTRLHRRARLENLRGAFRLARRVARRQPLRGKPVLLIDDVFTTGSTANECARVLKAEAGAEKVVVLTVLRG